MTRKKLTVVMVDTFRTYIAVTCENEHLPYGRRVVQIPLTAEQLAMIEPRQLGQSHGKNHVEEIGAVWLEDAADV